MPFDFWRLTPAEFLRQVKANAWRDEQQWKKLAWQTAHLINIWLKKEDRVSVDDLMPKPKTREPQTVEEQARNMRMWVKILGGTEIKKRGENDGK